MEVSIGKSPINGPFSVAMFDYQRVNMLDWIFVGNASIQVPGPALRF